jgi:hypothetical protein
LALILNDWSFLSIEMDVGMVPAKLFDAKLRLTRLTSDPNEDGMDFVRELP